MYRSNVVIVVAVAAVFSSPLAASAQTTTGEIPSRCASVAERRSFSVGWQAGANLVRQAWDNVGNDCENIEELRDIIIDGMGRWVLPRTPSSYVACRYGGFVSGVADNLGVPLATLCDGWCDVYGETVGEIFAMANCELLIAFGGLGPVDGFLRGPVALCGASFTPACHAGFESGLVYENGSGSCKPFTEDLFVFDVVLLPAREAVCGYDYVLPPEP